jgi:hypothetical protein
LGGRSKRTFGAAALLLLLATIPLQSFITYRYGISCHGEHLPTTVERLWLGLEGLLLLSSAISAALAYFKDSHRALAVTTLILFFPVLMFVGLAAGCN